MALNEFDHFFCEAKLSTKARKKLDDSEFGIPELRKYPLTDKKHVLQAVRFFNKAEEKYKPELARRIVKRAKELDMEWENWDVLKPYLSKGKQIKEYAETLSDTPEAVKCLETLLDANVKYDKATPNTWRLKSPDSVIRNKKGNCHDISYYVYKNLDKFAKKKVGKGILFVMEYKEGSEKGGVTHSVCYEKIKGGVCFIEYSWDSLRGTFPRNNIQEEIDVIKHNWKFSKGFDKLFFAEIKNVDKLHPGMTLDQYVKIATSNKEIVSESFAYDAIMGERIDLGPSAMTEEELRSRMVHGNGDDFTSGTSLTRDGEYDEPDDCYCESDGKPWYNDKGLRVPEKCTVCDAPVKIYLRGEPVYLCSNKKCGKYYGTVPCNVNESEGMSETEAFYKAWHSMKSDEELTLTKDIASKIHEKYESDKKEPTGNQNCQLCTWCAEAQFRGIDVLPRPVYSPRDPVLEIPGESIVKNPRRISLKSGFDDMLEFATEPKYSRWYCHVKWKDGHGGHEFLLIDIDRKLYLMDPQQGIVTLNIESKYFKDVDFTESFMCRLDNCEFNTELLDKWNSDDKIVKWDASLDIPFMVKEGLLSPEEAEEYWKTHPDERPQNNGKYLTYEFLNKMFPDSNPIQESFMMEFDHNSEKIPVPDKSFDKLYFGSPTKYDGIIELDRPLFVTPFIGIASIFIYGDLDIQNKVPRGSYNLQYEEWMHASEEDLNKPFKDVHVYVEGYPELEPYEVENTGYIHVIDGHEYAGRLCRYDWMADDLEYLIDNSAQNEVQIDKVIECTVRYHVSGKASNNPKLGPYKKNIQESSTVTLPEGIWMRPAMKGDRDYILMVEIETLDDEFKNDQEVLDAIKKDAYESIHKTRIICHTKSETEAETIGLIQAYQKDDYWYIGEIYLEPGFRGKGIGKAILEKEISEHDWLSLDVSKNNKHAIDLYLSLGFKIVAQNKYGYRMDLKKQPIQESAWQDIKNGVNPFSKDLVFHISKNGALDGQIFKPRVPDYITKYDSKDPKFEDNTTGRICFSPSIEGCLNAILVNIGRWKTADKLGDWYVYIPEKPLNEYKHSSNKDIVKGKKVYDANLTKEIWIEEPVRLKQYGVIHVDQVKASDRKHTVPTSDNVKGDRRYYTFKWHWLVKPKVLKDVKYDYSKHETTENLEEELWRFKYGLIKDGKLVKNTSKEDWYKYWRLADPEEFEQAKGGNCYDYVEWEAGYLDAFGYKCNKYFILASNGNTHAFIVVPDDGKFYFVDGAFNKIDGKTNIMKEFNSLQDCFEYITDAIKKYEKNESLTFTIYDYTKEDMKPGTPMKEFEEWITSHGKKVNMSKSIKEEYSMNDFERDPSVFRMFMEADDDTDKDDDKKEDTKVSSSDNKNDTDEEGDAIVSVSTTEITTTTDEDDDIGMDDGSGEQNQYDPKEVEYLNKLIASEADAISEYFESGKLTRVPVLSKLYTDIGDEERFHLEQLIYAKSYLTGDKYEPKDSKVRREYEELLELGMDEETAMTTAIDKTRLMPEDDITEEEIEEFAILSQMSEMMSFQNEIIMECMDDTSDIRKALSNANTEAFMESVFIMEDVSNLNTKQGQKELGSKNPIRVIIGMFRSIYRIIINLVKKAKLAFQKKRLKNKKKWAWIKKHGIKGLFQSGVSLYFWNDQTNKYEITDALKYLQMVWDTCNLIIKNAGITDIPEEKFSIQKIIQTLGADIKFKPMYVKNLDSAIKDLQGTMLSKSKLIVNDNNQEEIEQLFFGYTESGYATMEREGENSKSIDLSKNIYNQMNIVLDAFSKSSAYVGELLNRLEIMEGKSDTIYQKNNKLYNKCVQTAGELTKALNKFNAAVSHDISTVTKIDNGLMEAVNKADEGDKTDLNKLNDDRAKAKAEAQKTATEEKQQTKTENQTRYNLT